MWGRSALRMRLSAMIPLAIEQVMEPTLKGIALSRIIEAYARHCSVKKAGNELGLVPQSVHRFLLRHGYQVNKPDPFTEQQLLDIEVYYKTAGTEFDLDILAAQIGRPKTSIARIARKLNLTDQSRMTSRMLRAVRANGPNLWKKYPHPRGMLGKKHSQETLVKVSAASKRNWATAKAFNTSWMDPEHRDRASKAASLRMAQRSATSVYSRTKKGIRPDLGIYFRSSWEANYARYLNLLRKMRIVADWDYEAETFWFDGIKRGTLSYKPDFRVIYRNDPIPEYIEIKGWVTNKDRTKWARMRKYHPAIKLTVIGQKEYKALEEKWSASIPEWERGRKNCRITVRPI